MNKKNIFSLVMFAVFSLGCTKKQISSDLDYYNLLKDEPIQEELDDEKVIKIDSFTLSPHYSFELPCPKGHGFLLLRKQPSSS